MSKIHSSEPWRLNDRMFRPIRRAHRCYKDRPQAGHGTPSIQPCLHPGSGRLQLSSPPGPLCQRIIQSTEKRIKSGFGFFLVSWRIHDRICPVAIDFSGSQFFSDQHGKASFKWPPSLIHWSFYVHCYFGGNYLLQLLCHIVDIRRTYNWERSTRSVKLNNNQYFQSNVEPQNIFDKNCSIVSGDQQLYSKSTQSSTNLS